MKYKYSFYVRPCKIDFEKVKVHSIINYLSERITYDEALRIYYEERDSIITWNFNFDPITITENKKSYLVIGDGIVLGTLIKEQLPEHQNCDITIKTIVEKMYIYSMHCFVTYGKYFRVPKSEYMRHVKHDPYKRGFASWADNSIPRRVILDIEFGDKELTKAEKYLRAKQEAIRSQG